MNAKTLNTRSQPLLFAGFIRRRRSTLLVVLAASLSLTACEDPKPAGPSTPPIAVREESVTLRETFAGSVEAWSLVEGSWQVRSGGDDRVLAQTATNYPFPVTLWRARRFSDVDVTVRFKPISGEIDASGGIVFRARDGANYYVVRANSLEDNFRLYTMVDGDRRQIAAARIEAPELGEWHTLRVVAVGDHIQAYLNDRLLLDHHDRTYSEGWVGLWTKADAVTEFDDVVVRGVSRGVAPPQSSAQAQGPRAEHSRAPAEDGHQWCAYITGFGSEEVCGIRVPSAESIGCVRTGEKPHGIALAQDGSRLYVSSEESNTVSAVEASTMRVSSIIKVGQQPNQIALTPDGSALWVTNNADHSVSVVDTGSNEVTQTIEAGRNPHIVVMNAARGQALVTSESDGAVDVFDLDTFERVQRIVVYGFPRVPTVAPSGERAFLTLRWLNGALVLDLRDAAVRERISVGERSFAEAGKVAHGIAVSHDGQLILLTTQTSGQLTWIDAHTLAALGKVSVGNDPNWVEFTPDDRYAVVSNTGDDTAVVVDVRQQRALGRAPVSAQPKRLAVGACPEARASSSGGDSL